MDVAAHQFSGGSIDHPVSFQRGHAGEARGGDDDVEMAAFTRAGVAVMFRAVVANLEQGRMQGGFERGAQAIARACSRRRFLRRSYAAQQIEHDADDEDHRQRTAIQTLKVTQSASLRCRRSRCSRSPAADRKRR